MARVGKIMSVDKVFVGKRRVDNFKDQVIDGRMITKFESVTV